MAKLDKIGFGQLIAYISGVAGYSYRKSQVEIIDQLIDIPDPEPQIVPGKADAKAVDNLLKFMAGGTNKIDAIREYRALTGMSLKESKDAVERYWNAAPKEYVDGKPKFD